MASLQFARSSNIHIAKSTKMVPHGSSLALVWMAKARSNFPQRPSNLSSGLVAELGHGPLQLAVMQGYSRKHSNQENKQAIFKHLTRASNPISILERSRLSGFLFLPHHTHSTNTSLYYNYNYQQHNHSLLPIHSLYNSHSLTNHLQSQQPSKCICLLSDRLPPSAWPSSPSPPWLLPSPSLLRPTSPR